MRRDLDRQVGSASRADGNSEQIERDRYFALDRRLDAPLVLTTGECTDDPSDRTRGAERAFGERSGTRESLEVRTCRPAPCARAQPFGECHPV